MPPQCPIAVKRQPVDHFLHLLAADTRTDSGAPLPESDAHSCHSLLLAFLSLQANHCSAMQRRAYKIKQWHDAEDFLTRLAQVSGKLLKGGEPDLNTAAKMVLYDWQRGKIPFFVLPPGATAEAPSAPSNTARAVQPEQVLRSLTHQSVAWRYDRGLVLPFPLAAGG